MYKIATQGTTTISTYLTYPREREREREGESRDVNSTAVYISNITKQASERAGKTWARMVCRERQERIGKARRARRGGEEEEIKAQKHHQQSSVWCAKAKTKKKQRERGSRVA